MKIGIWHNTGAGGGARRHLYQHVKGLTGRGHEVLSCCPELTGAGEHDIGQLVHEERIAVPGRFDGRRLVHGRWNYNRALHDAMEVHCKQAASYLDGEGVDVLLATNCAMACIPSIGSFIHAPSAIYIHDPHRGYHFSMNKGWAYPDTLDALSPFSYWGVRERWEDFLQLRERRIYIQREIRNAGAYDLRLTNSYFCREALMRSYRLDTRVAYQGVDTEVFLPGSGSRETFILGVGSFWVHKNIEFLIRGMAKCNQSRQFVWIGNSGSDAQRTYYEDYAADHGVAFTALSGVSDAVLVDHYQRAALLVCAARLEPFGLTPLEANACGCPVLATREGGMRETVIDGYNGWLVDEDEEVFAAKLDAIMADDTAREQAGRNGIEHVQSGWTLEQSVERLEAQLVQLVDTKKS